MGCLADIARVGVCQGRGRWNVKHNVIVDEGDNEAFLIFPVRTHPCKARHSITTLISN